MARVVDTLKLIADVVVLDVPCTYDDIYFETLAAANQAILIGEQKLPSIRALKMVREAIGRPGGTEHLVLNGSTRRTRGSPSTASSSPWGSRPSTPWPATTPA